MSMVVTEYGMQVVFDAAFRGVPFSVFYGLFMNDWHPVVTSVIADVQPCNFSGYSGLLPIMSWGAPFVLGDHVVSNAADLVWTRGVGTQDGWVLGYYAVDAVGKLLWGEQGPDPSVLMSAVGQPFRVIPGFRVSSHYGG